MKPPSQSFRSFAIVPAAGRSRRMGQDKLLMAWGESTVIESLLAAWRGSNVDQVVVVSRSDHGELHSLCNGPTVVTPSADPPEMKDSVLAALQHIRAAFSPNEADVWLLAPADMPHLSSDVIDQLLAAYDPKVPSIVVPTYNGRRGHPVLFPWSCAAAVEQLADNQGVNALLQQAPVRECECETTEIHGDLDTPDDYERLRDEVDSHAKAQRRKGD